MPSNLEGASCVELNPAVIDHFFEPHGNRLMINAAKRICLGCTALDACRLLALNGPRPARGTVLAGMTYDENRSARSWLRYELGGREQVPRRPRPEWLPRNDAAEMVEWTRLEQDADEVAV